MRKPNAEIEYQSALDSASEVVTAILSLDIPKQHKTRYLNRAIWHVTVPKESMKYRTRFASSDALCLIEKIMLLRQFRQTQARMYKAVNTINGPETLLKITDPELKRVINSLSLDLSQNSDAEILAALRAEEKKLRLNLRHDHVETRNSLISRLLSGEEDVTAVLREAQACTVTRTEHDQKLNKLPKNISGTNRYKVAGIVVIDTQSGEKAAWGAQSSNNGSGANGQD